MIAQIQLFIDDFRGFTFMIFEEVQLCFSSDYIDDFRGINRSEGIAVRRYSS